MVKPAELQQLGVKISQDFLEQNVPLTEGLSKVASLYGLNRNQVHRVAEVANVKTHLHMLKEAGADNAYIVFDVADPLSVTTVTKIKEAHYTDDYNTPPQRDSAYTDESIFKVASFKEDSEKVESPAQKFKDSVALRSKIAALESRCLEGSIRLETRFAPLYALVKQAVLSGADKESITYIVKEAAPLGDYVLEELNADLARDGIKLEINEGTLEKYASKEINTKSQLYSKLIDLNDEAVEILKTAEELIELRATLGEHPIEKRVSTEEIN